MEKKLLPETFLSYQKRIVPMDFSILLELSATGFWVKTMGG